MLVYHLSAAKISGGTLVGLLASSNRLKHLNSNSYSFALVALPLRPTSLSLESAVGANQFWVNFHYMQTA